MVKWKIIGVVLLTLLVGLGIFFIFYHLPKDTDKIYSFIYIHGVPVGGLNRQEAEIVLNERFQPLMEARTVAFTKNNEVVATFTFADFGARLNFSNLLDMAFEYSYLRKFPINISRIMGRSYEINDAVGYSFDSEKMQGILMQLSEKLDKMPENAYFALTNGEIVVYAESEGFGINIEAAAIAAKAVLESFFSGVVELSVITVQPQYKASDFDFAKSVIGEFSTYVAGATTTARGRNIKRAANRINNKMLFPGQVFSAGTIIGANAPSSGYEAATVLVQGEPVEDIGGGVCQVVSTLYNAVLLAELEVVQRHNHSARVGYVELGFDATVAGDYFDLKFKNNLQYPLLITSRVENGNLLVEIIGSENRPTGRTIHFATTKVDIQPPLPYREIVDPSIPRGQRLVTLESQMGFKVELHKVVYVDNKEVERIKINTSSYKPVQGVIAIGAG